MISLRTASHFSESSSLSLFAKLHSYIDFDAIQSTLGSCVYIITVPFQFSQ